MKKIFIILLFVITCANVFAQLKTPRQLFPGLFEAVQLSDIFPDNKTFVDATPKRDPQHIMADYQQQKSNANFDLKQFVYQNFEMPAPPDASFKTDIADGVKKHIDTLWKVLYRKHTTVPQYSSLLPLPHGFIVPGGRFREIYYWDSYFTMLGLHEAHKTEIIKNMIDDFAFLIDTYGFIPNGTRTYYLTRSQPPFFSLMVDLLAKDEGDQVYIKYQPELLKEYEFWMRGSDKLKVIRQIRNSVAMPGGEVLNRYWDESDKPREESFKKDVEAAKLTKEKPEDFYRNIRAAAESGWDFSTRWMDTTGKLETIRTTDIIPIDLNCLLYHLEITLEKASRLKGNIRQAETFKERAENRKKAILKYCWSESEHWFMDYDWKRKHTTPNKTLAGTYPLEFGIADERKAKLVATVVKSDFFKTGGLVTTLKRSGQQWDSPNAWAPLQYMTIDGLTKYGQMQLANDIAQQWIHTNISVFNDTGKLMEKYDVVDTDVKAGGGEYPLQDGFGWTNGVLTDLMARFHTALP